MIPPLLEARGLKKLFPVTKGLIFQKTVGWVRAVDGIDFVVQPGRTFGIVGESGCGKTTAAKVVLLLEKKTDGTLFFDGADVDNFREADLGRYRASVQAVFQDPYASLNPRMRVGDIIAEPIQINDNLRGPAINDRVADLLDKVELRPGAMRLYPHEFSSGQRQRIAIARALSLNPRLVVLDEPISALDASIRAQIMNLLQDLQASLGLAYLLIAHNLSIVRYMSDQVAVMYLGKIVERGESEELYGHPLHPYTKALFKAALPSHPRQRRQEPPISGEVPSPIDPPHGCRFHPRCPDAKRMCQEEEPFLKEQSPSHAVACHLYSSPGH